MPKTNRSIKCTVDECVYNDPEKSYCTLDDINVEYDPDLEMEAICSSFETVDDFDDEDPEDQPTDASEMD